MVTVTLTEREQAILIEALAALCETNTTTENFDTAEVDALGEKIRGDK